MTTNEAAERLRRVDDWADVMMEALRGSDNGNNPFYSDDEDTVSLARELGEAVVVRLTSRESLPTDEQAEGWLSANDLYAVTHIHESEDCGECQAAPPLEYDPEKGPTAQQVTDSRWHEINEPRNGR